MKQFLKSALYTALILSSAVLEARHHSDDCCTPCPTTCTTGAQTVTTAGCPQICNTGCNTGSNCGTSRRRSGDCSDGRRRHHNSDRDCFNNSCASEHGRGYVLLRSQNDNLARQMAGFVHLTDRPDVGQPYGAGYIAYEFQRSTRNHRLARSLFGAEELHFVGSGVPNAFTCCGVPATPGVNPTLPACFTGCETTCNTGCATGTGTNVSAVNPTCGSFPGAFVAELFGLPNTFIGSVRFRPRVENHILEFCGYYNFSECPEGAYFRFYAPLVHSKWRLCPSFCDNSCTNTFTAFPQCTFSTTSTTCPASFGQALTGTFGGAAECGGFFDCIGRRHRTRLADLKLILGYNICNTDCGHVGLYLIGVAPTGNRQHGRFIFDPMIGNGHHGELGIGIEGHRVLWDDNCGDQNLSFYWNGYVTHMFKSRQCRTLDFCGRPMSRFLLLREFQTDGVTPTGRLVSATCFNRRQVDVRVNAKGEGAFMFAYNWCGFGFDLGYNIYGHTREKVRFRNECRPCDVDNRRFGIAGTSGVCCFTYPTALGSAVVPGIPEVATCTVISGPATGVINPVNATFSNASVFCPTTFTLADNPVTTPALTAGTGTVCLPAGVTPLPGAVVATTPACTGVPAGYPFGTVTAAQQSTRPNLVSVNDLDPHSAQANAVLTHKIFGDLRYTWADDCGYNPTISVGGEYEFERSCDKPSLNQFGVWVKLASTF